MSWPAKNITHLFSFFLIVVFHAGYSQDTFEDIYDRARHELSVESGVKAYEIAQYLNDKQKIGKSAYLLGYIYNQNTDYFNSLNYYFKSLRNYRSINDQQQVANVVGNIALIYIDCGLPISAEKYLLDAFEIKKELGDTLGYHWNMYELGRLHCLMENKDQALDYLLPTLEYFESIEDRDGASMVSNEVGIVHYDSKDLKKAQQYYRKTIESAIPGPKYYLKAMAYNNLGMICRDHGDTLQAIEYFKLAINDESSNDQSKFLGYTNLGRLGCNDLSLMAEGVEFGMKGYLRYSEFFVESCERLIDESYARQENEKHHRYAKLGFKIAGELTKHQSDLKQRFKHYQAQSATYKAQAERKEAALLKTRQYRNIIVSIAAILFTGGWLYWVRHATRQRISIKNLVNRAPKD